MKKTISLLLAFALSLALTVPALAYDEAAEKLASMFEAHMAKRYPELDEAVLNAGPHHIA